MNTATEKKAGLITGVFNTRESAERAYDSLIKKGYKQDEITVLMSDNTRDTHFADNNDHDSDLGNKAMEGAGTGSAIGGTTGAILGALAATGLSVALPGLGIVLAGPLAGALAGAGAGGLTGGIIGALVGAGMPKERAERYKDHIKEGSIVIGVTPRDENDATAIQDEWNTYQGQDIYYK
ncbi:MAG: general stress protein [Tunicatimonas sp.]|uniref:hypothetical protein n=1 Tax=Tunicatimonas sp. TaxID=1940096 RepID=UPI003C7138F1